MNPTNREVPGCLGGSGRTLWEAVVSSNEISDSDAELLLLACKQSDRAAEARAILQGATIIDKDRFHQEKPHPAVAIERAASLACAKLLSQFLGVKVPAAEAEKEEDFFK